MRTLLIIIFILSFSMLVANPILSGPLINEIYFENDEWQIELFNMGWNNNLDDCLIATSTDSSLFNQGIYFPWFECTIITQLDLQNPININQQGDVLRMFIFPNSWFEYCSFSFGDFDNSWINSPYPSQSLATFLIPHLTYPDNYLGILAKDNSPTLGGQNDSLGVFGIFWGYVSDSNGNPIEGALIKLFNDYPYISMYFEEIYTNSAGYFADQLYAKNYPMTLLYQEIVIDTLITIEPDSLTYCEFVLETTQNDEYEIASSPKISIFNYPNPFNPKTTIYLNNPISKNAKIVIYNSKGQKVDELSIPNSQSVSTGVKSSIVWNAKEAPSGVYLYNLLIGGKQVASNKMLLLK